MDAFWISLAVVFVAELGDKSQLMALAFATRYRASQVLIGITVATAIMCLVAVLVGTVLSETLPTDLIGVVAGLAFLGFGLWTLRGGGDDEEGEATLRSGRSPIVGVGLAFLVAEIGDKTMLATLTLAMTGHWAWVWAGSTLGMAGASALAVLVGNQLGTRLPDRVVRYTSAGLFLLFGVLLLVGSLRA